MNIGTCDATVIWHNKICSVGKVKCNYINFDALDYSKITELLLFLLLLVHVQDCMQDT